MRGSLSVVTILGRVCWGHGTRARVCAVPTTQRRRSGAGGYGRRRPRRLESRRDTPDVAVPVDEGRKGVLSHLHY